MRIPRAVAVVVDEARVLVIKRYLRSDSPAGCAMCRAAGPGAAAPGAAGRARTECPGHRYAVLPGGGVEDGESHESAALRELKEETTLDGRIDRLLWTSSHNGRPASYFLIADVAGTPVLSGSEAAAHGPDNSFVLAWVTPGDFVPLNLRPADIHAPLTALLGAPTTDKSGEAFS